MEDDAKPKKKKKNTLIIYLFEVSFKSQQLLARFILSPHSQWHGVLSHSETLFSIKVQVKYQTANARANTGGGGGVHLHRGTSVSIINSKTHKNSKTNNRSIMSEVGWFQPKGCKQRPPISPGSTTGPGGEFHNTAARKKIQKPLHEKEKKPENLNFSPCKYTKVINQTFTVSVSCPDFMIF